MQRDVGMGNFPSKVRCGVRVDWKAGVRCRIRGAPRPPERGRKPKIQRIGCPGEVPRSDTFPAQNGPENIAYFTELDLKGKRGPSGFVVPQGSAASLVAPRYWPVQIDLTNERSHVAAIPTGRRGWRHPHTLRPVGIAAKLRTSELKLDRSLGFVALLLRFLREGLNSCGDSGQ